MNTGMINSSLGQVRKHRPAPRFKEKRRGNHFVKVNFVCLDLDGIHAGYYTAPEEKTQAVQDE